MGRPKGSKNKPKSLETTSDSIKYTVTATVNVMFDITLPSNTDPHTHLKGKRDLLMQKVKKGTLDLESAQVKRYEW